MKDPLRCQVFDHGCDECMLPWQHYDDPRINDLPHDGKPMVVVPF